jgi:hypothetical protein
MACISITKSAFPTMRDEEIFSVIDRVNDCITFKNKSDVVEVVRCKDCKEYRYGRCDRIDYIMDGYYQGTFEMKRPEDFCSYGERKDT